MSKKESSILNTVVNPLGQASPGRYQPGRWPTALLNRMVYWARRIHGDGKLLDLGCGEGALLQQISGEAFGVDLNPERLALSVEKNLPVTLADGCLLPFADEAFDTVISMEVLEHVPDMNEMMQEVRRALKPGGHWVISAPSVTFRSWYEMSREHRPYYCDVNEHYREFSPVELPWFEHRFISTQAFEEQLHASGFDLQYRDGVRYLFPQWFSRVPALQRVIESERSDRLWSHLPIIHNFPYWMIRVLRRRGSE